MIIRSIFWIYLLIILSPFFIIFLIFIYKKYVKTIKFLFDLNLIPKIIITNLFKIQKIRLIIYYLIFANFLFVLSGPQWGLKQKEVKTYGIDMVLVLDVSKSMLTEDVLPNRLEFAKKVSQMLVERIETHRVGIITFAGIAFYHCPLTIDMQAVKDFLSIVDVDIVNYPGTKIALALKEALRVLKNSPSFTKVIILFTDGEDHDSEPLLLIDEIKNNKIIIYTVGVGTGEGKPIPIRDQFGNIQDYKKDKKGNIVISRLNESLLYELAEKTNGRYFSLNYGEINIVQQIINEISNLKHAELKSKVYNIYIQRYHYFIYLIIILFLIDIFVPKKFFINL